VRTNIVLDEKLVEEVQTFLTSALFPHKPQQNKDCKKTGALLFQYFSRI